MAYQIADSNNCPFSYIYNTLEEAEVALDYLIELHVSDASEFFEIFEIEESDDFKSILEFKKFGYKAFFASNSFLNFYIDVSSDEVVFSSCYLDDSDHRIHFFDTLDQALEFCNGVINE